MAKGKYKKRKKKITPGGEYLKHSINLNIKMIEESPGNIISGYCFTDKDICTKIDPISHNCSAYIDPISKCKPGNPFYGCSFSPTRKPEKVDKRVTISGRKSRKKRAGKISSQTAGRTKGGNCVASPIERYCAKYSRAYKKEFYKSVIESMGRKKR